VQAGMGQRWLRRFNQARPGTVRLACFPHAGGSAGAYRWLSDFLSPDVDVLCVQYPGRQDRAFEKPIDTIAALAAQISAALAAEPGGQLVTFGHSMGSIVAFEVARLIERRGTGPQLTGLIASASSAPSRVRDEGIHKYGDEALLAELARLGGTEQSILSGKELWRLVLPAVRADYKAIETYQPATGGAVSAPIVVYTGSADQLHNADEIESWQRHTQSSCRFRRFRGGHFYMQDREPEVAQAVATDLGQFCWARGRA
jgi:pyochelin biosynthesis protein PchC